MFCAFGDLLVRTTWCYTSGTTAVTLQRPQLRGHLSKEMPSYYSAACWRVAHPTSVVQYGLPMCLLQQPLLLLLPAISTEERLSVLIIPPIRQILSDFGIFLDTAYRLRE